MVHCQVPQSLIFHHHLTISETSFALVLVVQAFSQLILKYLHQSTYSTNLLAFQESEVIILLEYFTKDFIYHLKDFTVKQGYFNLKYHLEQILQVQCKDCHLSLFKACCLTFKPLDKSLWPFLWFDLLKAFTSRSLVNTAFRILIEWLGQKHL